MLCLRNSDSRLINLYYLYLLAKVKRIFIRRNFWPEFLGSVSKFLANNRMVVAQPVGSGFDQELRPKIPGLVLGYW